MCSQNSGTFDRQGCAEIAWEPDDHAANHWPHFRALTAILGYWLVELACQRLFYGPDTTFSTYGMNLGTGPHRDPAGGPAGRRAVGDPPAHHPVQSQPGTRYTIPAEMSRCAGFCNATFPGALPRLKSAGQPLRARRVEPQHPFGGKTIPPMVFLPALPHRLQPYAARKRRIPPHASRANRCQSQKPAHLSRFAVPKPANPTRKNPPEAQPPNPSQTSHSLRQ